MSADETATAILENPADDGPRLDLAARHERNGRPEWGEFIRLQIDLALRLHPAACGADTEAPVAAVCDNRGCSYCSARAREWALIQILVPGPHPTPAAVGPPGVPARDWREAVRLDGWDYPQVTDNGYVVLRRGMTEAARITLPDWQAYGAALLATSPVSSVLFRDTPGMELAIRQAPEGGWRIDASLQSKRGFWTEKRCWQGETVADRPTLVGRLHELAAEAARGAIELAEAYPI